MASNLINDIDFDVTAKVCDGAYSLYTADACAPLLHAFAVYRMYALLIYTENDLQTHLHVRSLLALYKLTTYVCVCKSFFEFDSDLVCLI